MTSMIGCDMPDVWTKPKGIYLRVWPRQPYERSTQAIFRWQEGEERRQERRVQIARRHADIPMTPRQYQIWDELRTDIALGDRAGDSVWSGLALWADDEWCQDHAFFCVMRGQDIQEIISLHYNRWLIGGRCQEDDRRDYVDWTFNSRRMLDVIS